MLAKTLVRRLTVGVGVVTASVLGGGGARSTQAQVQVQIPVDPLAIGQAIAGAVQAANGREAFVKDTLERMVSQTRGQYNVMVFNLGQGFEFNPDFSKTYYTSVNYNGTIYGIWIFRGPVHFQNKGDGGWINWGMYGSFQRDGNSVQFN